jgi:hypothetical protein
MISYIHQKDRWYEHFFSLSTDEKYKMFIEMLNKGVSDNELIEDDFGTVAVEFKGELIYTKKYEEAVDLIEKIKASAPILYQKEFPYLSNFTVEYYLYKDDLENVLVHLEPFLETPDKGYDLFIPLFNKIRFYKKNDLALKIVDAIYEPVAESDKLIGGAELELLDFIFYNLFQDYYTALKNGQEPEWQQIEDTLKNFDYDDAFFESDLPRIQQVLKQTVEGNGEPTFSYDEWKAASEANWTNADRDLFWSFAAYMLKLGDFHFSISNDIWFGFSRVLMKGKSHGDFTFRRHELEEVISNFFGFMSTKEEEGFALLWGIPYIYDFLDDQQLITKEIKEQALNDVKAIKDKLIKGYKHDIWKFDFVHTWEKPKTIPTEEFANEVEIFHQSFIERPIEEDITSTESIRKSYSQMSIEDFLDFSESSNRTPKQPKAAKKKKRKQAKNQRKRNRKK